MKKIKLILSIILFILICQQIKADDTLDSLYKATTAALSRNDTTQIIIAYRNLGDYHSEMGDFEKSDSILLISLTFSIQKKDTYQTGTVYNYLAANASYSGNRPKAISYYHKALKAFADIKNLDKVSMVLLNMGSEYEYMGNLKKAIAYQLKALKNKEASGVRDDLDYYYQSIGQLFKETNPKKWEFYVRKAYEVSKTLPETRIQTKAGIFNDLAGIAKINKKYYEAYTWYDSLITYSREKKYLNGLVTGFANRSILLLDKSDYDNALKDILEAIKISEKTGRNYSKISYNINAANILMKMKRFNEAKKHATYSLGLAQSLKYYPEEQALAHLVLSNIGKYTGNWEEAYKNFNAYKAGIDSIRNADVQKNMLDLETKYRTVEKEKKIAQLDNENKLKNAEIKRTRLQIYTLIISILLISVVIYLLYFRYRLNEQKHKAELKQKLLRSQMNPHFLFNTLNAINQYIQTNKGEEASEYLAKYSKLMRQMLENSAVEYVSLETEIEFLNNYLTMQKLRFQQVFDYTLETNLPTDPENIDVPPMIAQPFIENAIEHGLRDLKTGGKLKISFGMHDNNLLLKVHDNGKGFIEKNEKDKKHTSFAMNITQERLKIFGKKENSLTIESPEKTTGTGTLVIINIPYKVYN